jgi:deoxyribodipyrimidine photolyase
VLPSTQTTVGASAIPSSTTILYANQLSSLAVDSTFGTALASNSAFVTALANNDAFVTAVANKIKGTEGNYGIATQTQLATTESLAYDHADFIRVSLQATQRELFTTQTQLATTQAELETIAPTLTDSLPFVNAIAVKIKGQEGNFGIATQAQLESTQTQLATTQAELATTKSQITTAINEGKASGIASVTASPNTWSLFTTSQIQNMAVGDLVLTRTNGSNLVLNYDIEQSEDLQTWTTYQAYALPLTNLPTNKAFVRIKAKQ